MGRRSAKIATRKNKADAKKAKVYGKIGKQIISVVKQGGSDPATNNSLATLLSKANDLRVPKDLIDRNIKRATDGKQADFQESIYESYGPGGTGFIIDCLTDNLNRTAGDVKAAITKSGGKVAEPGSVMFNFLRQGQLLLENSDEESVFEAAMEAGAEDVQPASDEDGAPTRNFKVYTQADQFGSTVAKLRDLGFTINSEESELVYRPTAEVEVDDESFSRCEAMMDRLLELDDVFAVYTNCEGLGS
eukprot:jgi/Chrzof1/8175/Cz03g00150.t1